MEGGNAAEEKDDQVLLQNTLYVLNGLFLFSVRVWDTGRLLIAITMSSFQGVLRPKMQEQSLHLNLLSSWSL